MYIHAACTIGIALHWNCICKAYRTVKYGFTTRTVPCILSRKTRQITRLYATSLHYTHRARGVHLSHTNTTQGSPARPRLARTKLRTSVSSVADMIYHGYASRLGAPVKMAPAHGIGPWHRPMAPAHGTGPWHRPVATAAHRACLLPCLGIHQATETVSCYALGRSGDAPIDGGRSADAAPPPTRRVDPLLRFRVVVVALLMLGLGLGCWG